MAASGWHPAHFTQKTCSFQVKTGLLHPLILKQMRQPLFLYFSPLLIVHTEEKFVYNGTRFMENAEACRNKEYRSTVSKDDWRMLKR